MAPLVRRKKLEGSKTSKASKASGASKASRASGATKVSKKSTKPAKSSLKQRSNSAAKDGAAKKKSNSNLRTQLRGCIKTKSPRKKKSEKTVVGLKKGLQLCDGEKCIPGANGGCNKPNHWNIYQAYTKKHRMLNYASKLSKNEMKNAYTNSVADMNADKLNKRSCKYARKLGMNVFRNFNTRKDAIKTIKTNMSGKCDVPYKMMWNEVKLKLRSRSFGSIHDSKTMSQKKERFLAIARALQSVFMPGKEGKALISHIKIDRISSNNGPLIRIKSGGNVEIDIQRVQEMLSNAKLTSSFFYMIPKIDVTTIKKLDAIDASMAIMAATLSHLAVTRFKIASPLDDDFEKIVKRTGKCLFGYIFRTKLFHA